MRRRGAIRLADLPNRKTEFIEPMDCAPVPKLLDGPGWVYEIKLDGYRAVAMKLGDGIDLVSRRRTSFNAQYPYIVEALRDLPDGTVVDEEIVALDDSGRPNFNLLSQFRSRASRSCQDRIPHHGRDDGPEGSASNVFRESLDRDIRTDASACLLSIVLQALPVGEWHRELNWTLLVTTVKNCLKM